MINNIILIFDGFIIHIVIQGLGNAGLIWTI